MTVSTTDIVDSFPLRLFSREDGAGFHDSHLGVVPYIISRRPLDRLELAQVSPFVIELPQHVPGDFSSVPVWFPGGVLLKQTQREMRFPMRIPKDTTVRYELEGNASVVVSEEGILLKNETSGPVVWKNFQIVPNVWP